MEQQFLIDSNAVIDYLGKKIPAAGMAFMDEIVNNRPTISVITQIEILSFNTEPFAYTLLHDFIAECNIIELHAKVVHATISIRQLHKIKTPDAIIAATALVYDKTLLTRNVHDFKNIKKMKILNPHELT